MRFAILPILLLSLGWATLAGADDRSGARDAYRRATRHYELGEFRRALEAFKEAYRSVPDPALLFDLGQCHRFLGEPAEAARAYRMYLLKLPEAPRREELRQFIERLERAAAEARPPEPKTEEKAPSQDPPPVAATAAPPQGLPPNLRAPSVPTPRPPTWTVFATGAVGVAALVTAAVLASSAQDLSDAERARDPLLRDPAAADRIRLFSSSANGLFIGSAALLVATGALALTARWRRPGAKAAAWLSPSVGGMAVAGRF